MTSSKHSVKVEAKALRSALAWIERALPDDPSCDRARQTIARARATSDRHRAYRQREAGKPLPE